MKTIFSVIAYILFANNIIAQNIILNVNNFNVKPSNNGIVNRQNIQQCIDSAVSIKNCTIYIPTGKYKFKFNEIDSILCFNLKQKNNISIIGESLNTQLILDNENPSNSYRLFLFQGNENNSTITIKNIHFIGPQNPGSYQQKNKLTHAIYVGQGNLITLIDSINISGNFFAGIVATGGGNNYCRKLTINNSELEAYGAFCAGMFGAGECNEFECDNVIFKRCGLASNETSDQQAFGVSIYCHPDISAKITNCQFYNNHRNSIQFASGTKIYNNRFVPNKFSSTKYQIFENNYFDSTATDAIQLGFYFPNPVIKNNFFYNKFYGIEIVHSAIIENNYFGKTVASAITHTTESLATNEEEINIFIKNNTFNSIQAVNIFNNIKKGICKNIISENNLYDCHGQTISLGSAIVGDTSDIYFTSKNDTFYSTRNGGFFLGYSHKVNIYNPIVFGERFIFIGAKPLNQNIVDSNSIIFIEKMNCPDNQEYCGTIFTNKNGGTPKVILSNSYINNINEHKIVENFGQSKNIFIYPNNKVYPLNISTKNTIGQEISTNYNSYFLKGNGSINSILLFESAGKNELENWQNYFDGILYFICLDKIKFTQNGNILNTLESNPNQKIIAQWNRSLKKWRLFK